MIHVFISKTKNIDEQKKFPLGVLEKTDKCINQNRLTKNADKMLKRIPEKNSKENA